MKKKGWYLLLGLLGLAACQDEQTPGDGIPHSKYICFSVSDTASTRALATSFEEGDEIGVFAVRQDASNEEAQLKSSRNYAENIRYRYDGTRFVAQGTGITRPVDGAALRYYAVYPYSGELSPTFSFAIHTDQSIAENHEKSDLLAAVTSPTKEKAVSLVFKHLLAKVTLAFSSAGLPAGELGFMFDDVNVETFVELKDHNTDCIGKKQKVVASSDGTYAFKAILPSQIIMDGTRMGIVNIDGKEYPAVAKGNLNIEQGKQMGLKATASTGSPLSFEVSLSSAPVSERDALIAIYRATGGDNWYARENWCSEKPLSEWDHVEVNEVGEVIGLGLRDNNLNGTLPAEIGELTKLEYMTLHYNPYLTGSLPEEFYKLVNLEYFTNSYTGMDGAISPKIGDLVRLEELALQGSGMLPEEIGKLQNLKELMIGGVLDMDLVMGSEITSIEELRHYVDNCISKELDGPITEILSELKSLQTLQFSGTTLTDFAPLQVLPLLEDFTIVHNPQLTSISKETIPSHIKRLHISETNISDLSGLENLSELEMVSNPKLTTFPMACLEMPQLKELSFTDNWALSGSIPSEIWKLKSLEKLDLGYNNLTGNIPAGISQLPNLTHFDVSNNQLTGSLPYDFFRSRSLDYNYNISIKQRDGSIPPPYTSTDYSANGEIITLQQATQGNDINIIFLGEGFLDIDMPPGGYFESRMKETMENFFALEPAKSYRDYFNVYVVKTVSANDITKMKNATLCFGYNTTSFHADKAYDIAQTVPGIDITKTLVTVVVNLLPVNYVKEHSANYVGTRSTTGKRLAVTTTGNNEDEFKVNVNRYSVGWGFAKLAYESTTHPGFISTTDLNELKSGRKDFGEGFNLSWDKTDLPWKHFIGHEKYPAVGAYEGGYEYKAGIWRPEEASVMGEGVLYFNAPSRELFVKRLKELAGETYSWEEFVAKDK